METRELVAQSDAVFLGAVGGPKWDGPEKKVRPEQGLLGIRKLLRLYANLRPVKCWPQLLDQSPFKNEKIAGVDLIIVRELTGGAYFGARGTEVVEGEARAFDTIEYSASEIRRIVQVAFALAGERRKKVTSVDKANVLDTSRLWRKIVIEEAVAYPEIALNHLYVDNCAMQLCINPAQFDVLVTENMFGDILSDQASVLGASLGMLPSASIGKDRPCTNRLMVRPRILRGRIRPIPGGDFVCGHDAADFLPQCRGRDRRGTGGGGGVRARVEDRRYLARREYPGGNGRHDRGGAASTSLGAESTFQEHSLRLLTECFFFPKIKKRD